MYVLIAPSHLDPDNYADLMNRHYRMQIARKAAFWIVLPTDPKTSGRNTQQLKEAYRHRIMEMFFILEVSWRKPENRRNK